MTADAERRDHHDAAMAPPGAATGDLMKLPPVQDQNTSAVSPLYVQGDHPGA